MNMDVLFILFVIYAVVALIVLIRGHEVYVVRDVKGKIIGKIPCYRLDRRYFSIMITMAILWPLFVLMLVVDLFLSQVED